MDALVLTTESDIDWVQAGYGGFFSDLLRLCRALGAGADAEDVVQDVLVYATQHRTQLRDQGKRTQWLRRIAVREVGRRRQRIRATGTDELMLVPAASDLGIDVRAAVAALPTRERQVVTLTYGLGYDEMAVAAALGIRRGTVAATLFHARRKLATRLADYRNEGSR